MASRYPLQHSMQCPLANRDPLAATHGELHSTAHSTHRPDRTPHGNSPAHRLHTGESGNTHHVDKKPEQKAHRRQKSGKNTMVEYPRPEGHGNCWTNGARSLPRTTLASPRNTDHIPRHHEVGGPRAPHIQQHTCTPRAPAEATHRE
jgi:hypothetical protein